MKKFAILLICLATLCALCACGDADPTPPPSAAPSGEPLASTEPNASGEPSDDPSVEPSAAPSAAPSTPPIAVLSLEPSAEPIPFLPDLGEFGVDEDADTVYPVVIKIRDSSDMSDRTVELVKQFVEMIIEEPLDEVRAIRLENIDVAEARFGDDLLAAYRFGLDLTMRDGLPPEGEPWAESYSFSIYEYGWWSGTLTYSPQMNLVTLNGEPLCVADAEMIEQKYGVDWRWWWGSYDEDTEALLRALHEEYVVGAGLAEGGQTLEMSPYHVTHRLLYDGEIKATAADGSDMTETFLELLSAADSLYGGAYPNNLYDADGNLVRAGRYQRGVYEALPMVYFDEIFEVEERLAEVFTENGRAQILDAEYGGAPLLLHLEEDDSWWYSEPRNSGWSVILLSAETLSASEGRIELLLTYGAASEAGWRREVRFVMVETADGWRVDDYPNFRYGFGPAELLRVIEGYDVSHMIYWHSYSQIDFDDPRFLGGYWEVAPATGRAHIEDGVLDVSIEYDIYDRGLGYSDNGPAAEFSIDLASGTLLESEIESFPDWFGDMPGGERYAAPDFTETELITWGLMFADIIADAAADFVAEHGE